MLQPVLRLVVFVLWFVPLLVLITGLVSLLGPRQAQAALAVQGFGTLAAAVLAGWICLRMLESRPPGALGFAWRADTPRELAAGFAIGGGSLLAVALLLAAIGWLRYEPSHGSVTGYLATLVWYVVLLAPAAAAEEALFRGYPFQVLVRWLGPVAAVGLLSLLFALAHAGNPHVGTAGLLNVFLAGVMLSVAFLRTGSLWFATAVHAGWNWMMAGPLDLPVSGLDWFPTPLYDAVDHGPDWVTGGAFGPEGGMAATLAFGLALALVVMWTGRMPPRAAGSVT
jgi:uncharacterized protein